MATIPTANSWNTTGNWNKKYLDPNTDAATAKKLYGMYGQRYNWMPLDQRLAPTYGKPESSPSQAPATTAQPTSSLTIPTAKTPAVSDVANSKELYPFLSMGKTPQTPTIPKYTWSTADSQKLVDQNSKVGRIGDYMTLPKNDALYNYQLEEGQRALDAKLAAQGLSNSGAEVEANRRLQGQLLADQATRQADMAKADLAARTQLSGQRLDAMNAYQNAALNKYANDIQGATLQANQVADAWKLQETEAQRLADMQQNESNRLMNQSNSNWGRLTDMLSYLQAANPLPNAQSASDSLAKIYEQMGTQIPQYMLQMK